MTFERRLETPGRDAMLDISADVVSAVAESGVGNGLCVVSSPHTTAGITINENADPAVVSDILMELGKVYPWEDGYRHAEGNSAAHLKASTMGLSATIPVVAGRLVLGTWQGVYFCEFDGPRRRRFHVSVMAE